MNEKILIVREPISLKTLNELAQEWHGTLAKGVADVENGVLALGGEWHMDANNVLIADGSTQSDIWGFNIYPEEIGELALEYISLINIRPAQGNTSMLLEDKSLQKTIKELVVKFIPELQI